MTKIIAKIIKDETKKRLDRIMLKTYDDAVNFLLDEYWKNKTKSAKDD